MIELREAGKALTSLIPLRFVESLANYAVMHENKSLLPPRYVVRDRGAYFDQILASLGGPDARILFLEFGVHQGASIRQWAGLNRNPDSRFVGFDSFVGLPEDWRGRKAGYFDTGGKAPEVADPRVSFVKGWFNESLPGALETLLPVPDGCQVVVHVDADLHSAALYLLTILGQRLGSFPVLFDEYGAGEARALRDVIAAHGGAFEPLLGLKRHARSSLPTRAFGRFRFGPQKASAA